MGVGKHEQPGRLGTGEAKVTSLASSESVAQIVWTEARHRLGTVWEPLGITQTLELDPGSTPA